MTLKLLKFTVITPFALVLRWLSMCKVTREPSLLKIWNVPVLCCTSFLLLLDSPNQVAKCPLNDRSVGSTALL